MKVREKKEEKYEKKYWLWVTRPKYYLDKKGNDRGELDPTASQHLWRSWTCSKETQKGDLALLWRSKRNLNQYLAKLGVKKNISPDSDIGYLFQIESDAYSSCDEETSSLGWSYSCEMIPIYKFKNPLTISDIKKNPYLQDWNALRGKFQHSSFGISNDYWERLNQLLMDRNPGYKKVLERVERRKIPILVDREEQIENQLAKNPDTLKQFGFNLDLVGRQMVCGRAGRIDLLFQDKKKNLFVVVELKNVRAGQDTFGQISSYMGWVKEKYAKKKELVKGLVISRGMDLKFESAMRINPDILQLDIQNVGFK